jgi:hypothetical protein
MINILTKEGVLTPCSEHENAVEGTHEGEAASEKISRPG